MIGMLDQVQLGVGTCVVTPVHGIAQHVEDIAVDFAGDQLFPGVQGLPDVRN